jgi:hypothetical protein
VAWLLPDKIRPFHFHIAKNKLPRPKAADNFSLWRDEFASLQAADRVQKPSQFFGLSAYRSCTTRRVMVVTVSH